MMKLKSKKVIRNIFQWFDIWLIRIPLQWKHFSFLFSEIIANTFFSHVTHLYVQNSAPEKSRTFSFSLSHSLFLSSCPHSLSLSLLAHTHTHTQSHTHTHTHTLKRHVSWWAERFERKIKNFAGFWQKLKKLFSLQCGAICACLQLAI